MLSFNMKKNFIIFHSCLPRSTLNSLLSLDFNMNISCRCNKKFDTKNCFTPSIIIYASFELNKIEKERNVEDEKWKRCMEGNREYTKGVRELFWSDYLIKIMIFHPFQQLSLSTFCFTDKPQSHNFNIWKSFCFPFTLLVLLLWKYFLFISTGIFNFLLWLPQNNKMMIFIENKLDIIVFYASPLIAPQ